MKLKIFAIVRIDEEININIESDDSSIILKETDNIMKKKYKNKFRGTQIYHIDKGE